MDSVRNFRAMLQSATSFEGEGTADDIGTTLERYDYTRLGGRLRNS